MAAAVRVVAGGEADACMQEKVLAQVEKEGKKPKTGAAKPKAVAAEATKTAQKAETADKATKAEEEEEVEEEDPVTKALNKYGIITENPWEKGVKCVPLGKSHCVAWLLSLCRLLHCTAHTAWLTCTPSTPSTLLHMLRSKSAAV